MNITNLFLKARHWQLFLVTFGIPMIFQFFMMGMMFSSIANRSQPDVDIFINYFTFFPILMFLFMGSLFGWFWSVATGLQSKIPAHVKMQTRKFKFFFIIPIAYILLLMIFMANIFMAIPNTFAHGQQPDVGFIGMVMAMIVPVHLFSMFCIFYCLYFVAKTFKTAELQRETTFSDFAGEFFMIWFYPLGIWIIQPKINKMMETK